LNNGIISSKIGAATSRTAPESLALYREFAAARQGALDGIAVLFSQQTPIPAH